MGGQVPATQERKDTTSPPTPGTRVLRAVVMLDVAESVRLIEQDEERFIRDWIAFMEHVKVEILPRFAGRYVKGLGDGMLLEFPDARSAVVAAFEIQAVSAARAMTRPPEDRILLRIGIELGEVVVGADDLFGRGVNRAARLVTLAGPGETVVSATVRDRLTADLDADIEDLGECYVKHVAEPISVYRVGPPGPRPVLRATLPSIDILPTLAVVPLTGRGISEEHAVLGEIIADEIIRDLSLSQELNVISRLSTTAFRDRGATLTQISTSLNAAYVASGSYGLVGNTVQIDMELADARSEQVLLRRRLAGPLSDLIAGNRDMIGELAAEICLAILSRELQRAQTQPLPTLKGYTLLMGAIALMHRLSRSDFERAKVLLETLVERAGRQAVPRAWLAKWYVLRVQQGWSTDPRKDTVIAMQSTRQALDSDPSCSLALTMDGLVHTHMSKRLDLAAQRYDDAIAANPNDSLAWLLKGTLHAFRDEGATAVACTGRALGLSPLDPHRYYYDSLAASACIADHRYEDALALARRSLRVNRNHTSTLRVIAVAQWQLGRAEEARSTAAQLMALEPDLTVSRWLERAPSAAYKVGKDFAAVLRKVGVPD